MWICGTSNEKLREPTPDDQGYGKGWGRGIGYWASTIHDAIGDGLLTFSFKSIMVSYRCKNI